MSENKFIAKLKGEPTPKSVVEIQNDRLVAPFKSSPMGHIADRDSSVVVAKGAQNWAVNQGQLVPVADDYAGTESDLTATSRVSGAGLWLNATYTFPQTGNEKNPVSAIIAPSAKWVLTLCGDSLFTNNGNSITLTMIVKIGASHISTKSFRISEQASQFSKRMAIDFSESEQQVIKALGGSPLTVQVLCDDEGASATIYGGMTHLTLLQRKVDADLVSTDNILLPEFIETLLEGYIIPEDYFNRYEYLDQIQDGGKAMPEFTRTGDKVEFTGWAKPATEVYSKTEIDDKFTVTNAQIDANATAIQKTRDDMNEEDGRLQTQITAHAAAITALQNEQTATGNQIQNIESKIPDGTSDTNPLINNQQLLDEEMDIRKDLNSGLSELQTQITAQAGAIATLDSEKLDKNQGSINAGKVLAVDEDGLVVPTAGGLQEVSHDNTMSGAGTDESPLGLSEAIKDEISNKLDKEYASDFRGEWPNYASVPSDSNAYPADTLGSYVPNFNDYIVVKDSSDYFVSSSKNLLEADVVGAVIQSTPTAKFIVNYDVWYLGVAYNGYMGSNVPLATFRSGVGTISFISNSADSYGVCRFVRLKPNTTYTVSAKNGGRCAIASLTDEGGGYSKFSTYIKTPTSLPITFTTNENSTYGIVLYANSNGTECKFEEIQLEIGSVATSYEASGGYYLEGTWRFKYAGVWGTNNKAGWTPEYRLNIDISHINNESIQTKDLTVGTAEGTLNMSITAGVATIATNNGLDIVSQTKFDTAPTTDDTTAWADANPTALVSKRQVADALASGASGLTSVATDDTMTGDGTPANPLGVAESVLGGGANLFDAKWADHTLDDMSWLRADNFTWHSGDVYVAAYEHLASEYEAETTLGEQTDTIDGITIYYRLAEDGHKIVPANHEADVQALYEKTGVAWYYILDTDNKQFKLPRTRWGFTGLRDSVGGYVTAGLPNITGSFYFSDNLVKNSNIAQYVAGVSGAFSAEPLTANTCASAQTPTIRTVESDNRRVNFNARNLSGIYGNGDTVQPPSTQMYLYFYVGNFTKSAVEQTAGITSEQLNAKADKAEIETQLASKANLAIFDAIYPVGSIYIGTQSTCPMAVAIPGSTWQLVSAGRALWTGNGSNGNTTIAAGLPNITGTFQAGTGTYTAKLSNLTGAFVSGTTGNGRDIDGGSATAITIAGFDASKSNSVYGQSTTVQPPAYVVNVWRRTA